MPHGRIQKNILHLYENLQIPIYFKRVGKMLESTTKRKEIDYAGSSFRAKEGQDITELEHPSEEETVSVVIPLYNEEKTIREVLERIPNHRPTEIIVVDDGSIDNSVEAASKVEKNIKIIRHIENKGYGASLLEGFRQSNGDIIVTLDSDGQHEPQQIPKLLIPILQDRADIIVGSRYLGRSHYRVPLHTRLGELFISLCLQVLYRQKVGNNQCGFRAFRREALNSVMPLKSTRFGFNTEILFKAAKLGFKISEVPVTIKPREHGSSYVQLAKILRSILIVLFLYLFLKLRMDKIFPQSIVGFFSTKIRQIIEDYL